MIKSDKHYNIFNNIEKYIENIEGNNLLKKFLKYYKKEWLYTNFIKFDLIYDYIISSRTNNICEGFHSYLNKLIQVDHPKQSLFVEIIKNIAVNNYKKYIENFISIDNINNNKDHIFTDCYDYLKII